MKFFIMGDSWGQGEYKNCQLVPDTGLERYLLELGHTVTNVSAGSACNFGQLRHAYWTLKEHADYDYIVWFHTEGVRDIDQIILRDPTDAPIQYPDFDLDYNYVQALEYLANRNYQYAQECFNEFQIPFIVIGGQGPVANSIHRYNFYRHLIPSWPKQLLAMNIDPSLCTFVNWPQLQNIIQHFGLDEKKFIKANINEFDRVEQVRVLLEASDLFPDDMHPSRDCFKQLAKDITDWTQNET